LKRDAGQRPASLSERSTVSRFVMGGDVPTETFDWGTAGMRSAPPGTGCESFVVMDVRLDPGFFHAFHKHPDQDEMIIVKSGQVTQFLEQESRELGPGDSIYIDKDVVHGSYNDSSEPAELQVVLAPAIGEGGYVAVDVSADEPWASLR
jgi:quercetin dioxygenase-like cupin family protein